MRVVKKDGNEIIFEVLNISTFNIKDDFLQGHLNQKNMQRQEKHFRQGADKTFQAKWFLQLG